MEVLYLTPGHTAHDTRFATAIRAAGHVVAVTVIPPAAPERVARNLVAAAIAAGRPDVIHAGPLQRITRLVADAGAHPLLAVSWGFDLLLDARSRDGRRSAEIALCSADALLVDCTAAADVARTLGMPAERTVMLPWGVDLDAFRPGRTPAGDRLRREAGWEGTTIALTTRSLEPVYGMDVAIRGFLDAATTRPDLRLLVVGDGSLRGALERLTLASPAGHRVRFAGSLAPDQMRDAFAAADLYLSASHMDGSSLGLLEAMASGLPAVATRTGGTSEWIEEGASGHLVDRGDVSGIAAAITRLADGGEAVRARLGGRGRAIVAARADWRRNVHRLFDAYAIARQVASER